MPKAKRDVLEINKFQLNVLKPFYIAVFLVAVFFAAMVYAFLFFPDKYSLTTMILTECDPSLPLPLVVTTILALIFSVGAFLLADRLNASRVSKENTIATTSAGISLLFSSLLLVYVLFQYLIAPQLRENLPLGLRGIEPHQWFVILAGFAVLFLIVWLFFWAYTISNKVLGPFERILDDLDKAVNDGSRTELYVRPGDEMFLELVSRINILIKRQKDNKNDRQSDTI